MRRDLLGILLLLCACDRAEDDEVEADAPTAPPAAQPRRVATQDEGLRVLVAELASSKACEMIRGQFRGLRDPKRPDTVIGDVWLRECRITNHGSRVTFHLSGNGWNWVAVVKKPVGATFDLHQYVRFAMAMEISGPLDVAYDTRSHVVSFWFTPEGAPKIQFEPVGEIDMNEEGAWSAVVGAMSAVFADSVDERAEKESRKHGTKEFRKSFGDGMAVTMDLCTGMTRFGLERPATGKMVTPDVGETRKVDAELQPGGLLVFGPHQAPHGMTVKVHSSGGPVRAELVCQEDADAVAQAFVSDGQAPRTGRALASAVVTGDATLRARAAKCPVVMVARPLPGAKHPVVFDWQRPAAEAARAMGGKVLQCRRD
jgi:hypothetical protein